MNILIFANGKAPIPSIQFLHGEKHDLLVVVDSDDNGIDNWQSSLKLYCKNNNIPFIQSVSFKESTFLKKISDFQPNVILSIQCRKLIQKEIIDMVKGEIFNFHFADLPKNRGCFPGIWHLLNDDYIGVTLHKLTPGIDDGPILDKIRRKIIIKDTGRFVYEWCCGQVLPLLKRNLPKIVKKNYKDFPQNNALANYYSRNSLDFSHLFVDWNQNSDKVVRFIQAFIFPPFQFPKVRFEKEEIELIAVLSSRKTKRKTMPGTILSVKDDVVKVGVKDGLVAVKLQRHIKLRKGDYFYL